jgi:transcriptional regulator of nitric oxide reductase
VSNGTWQGDVLVGKEAQLPARLVLVRVPEEVIAQRRQCLYQEARRRGRAVNAQMLQRAAWTILITNVLVQRLSLSQVIVLQRARWQIERLFHLWKDAGHVDEWQGRTPSRILCEIFAKSSRC